MKKQVKKKTSLVTKIAKKLGEHSVDAACIWWACQPKVPDGLKNKNKNN